MTVTTTPIPPVSRATTIIPVAEMNDVNNTFKLVNIPQNLQQITKFPVWEIPRNRRSQPKRIKWPISCPFKFCSKGLSGVKLKARSEALR
jgi:hypothetical protein